MSSYFSFVIFSILHFTFVGLIYFDVGIKNPKIMLDDHDYRLYRKLPDKTVWLCSHYYVLDTNMRCKNRIVTSGRVAYVSGQHNHPPKLKKEKYKNMLSQMVTIVRSWIHKVNSGETQTMVFIRLSEFISQVCLLDLTIDSYLVNKC